MSRKKKQSPRILIVDDEEYICASLFRLMKQEGFDPAVAYEGETALKMISRGVPDLLLLDYKLPGISGMEVLHRVKQMQPVLPVIMITGYADIPGAVAAMKAGTYDYFAKPFDHKMLIRSVHGALDGNRAASAASGDSDFSLTRLMGPSDNVRRLVSEVNRVARSDFSVVILGETGSGKELVAQAVHNASFRADLPFVAFDCGAIPEALLESELFGHEKGAFTGAVSMKVGKFEAAKGGTLFMDEIPNLTLGSQAKLLRVLQEKKAYRVGSAYPFDVDARLVVAGNRDLGSLEEDSFRKDLFFRLSEFVIKVPPLRVRRPDIPYLSHRFLNETNLRLNKRVNGFSDESMEILTAFDWPGNVRQLKSTIRRAVLLADDRILRKHLDIKHGEMPEREGARDPSRRGRSLKEVVGSQVRSIEREMIRSTLRKTGGNKAKAARLLQIDYKTIHTKIKQLGILTDGGNHEQ